jgi:rhodanese-related sulfurtransferase
MRPGIVTAAVLTWFMLGGCAGESDPAPVADANAALDAAPTAAQTPAPVGAAPAAVQTPAPVGPAPTAVQTPAPGRTVAVAGGEYRDIIVPELQAMLEHKDFPLINVHVPFAGDLPGTDESIRYDQVASNLDKLPADKNARIVLYCRTGPMSTRAARDLVALGYTNVYNLVGGFTAWVEAGLPLVTQ